MKIKCYFNVHDYMPDTINLTAWPSFVILYTLQLCSSSYGKGYKRNYIICNLSPAITVDCSLSSFTYTPYGGGGSLFLQIKLLKNKKKFRHRWHDFSIGGKKASSPQTTVSPKEYTTRNSVSLSLICWVIYNINWYSSWLLSQLGKRWWKMNPCSKLYILNKKLLGIFSAVHATMQKQL